ncbi:MAG: hypothetical protein LM562_06015 [Pyrobaculum sp.]|nr:hypothetical protein [Pyrobaculum sp.]
MHPKWQERHVRHFRDALAALEAGEGTVTCYDAYVSVEALLKGILGFSPYGDLHRLERLPSLLERRHWAARRLLRWRNAQSASSGRPSQMRVSVA